jgi:hypothetical protein
MSYKKPSYKKTVFDITISMALVGLFVVLLAGFIGQTRKPNEIEIRAVDLSAIARGAETRTELSIWVPGELAEGWVATSGRLEQIQNLPTWRFGLVTPSREFIGVKVSENDPERMLQVSGYEITKSETISINQRSITQWEDEIKNERGYFFVVGEENILIYGTADFAEQLFLLESLEKLGPA